MSRISNVCLIRDQIENPLRTTVGINNNINTSELSNLHIPITPIAEQQAIVERAGNLMAVIDELEKQVTERKDQSESLMQSVLREAFESGHV